MWSLAVLTKLTTGAGSAASRLRSVLGAAEALRSRLLPSLWSLRQESRSRRQYVQGLALAGPAQSGIS